MPPLNRKKNYFTTFKQFIIFFFRIIFVKTHISNKEKKFVEFCLFKCVTKIENPNFIFQYEDEQCYGITFFFCFLCAWRWIGICVNTENEGKVCIFGKSLQFSSAMQRMSSSQSVTVPNGFSHRFHCCPN